MKVESFEMPLTEADVVIVLVNSEGSIRVIPYWECETPVSELTPIMAYQALLFAEEGGGRVDGAYFDRRPEAITSE